MIKMHLYKIYNFNNCTNVFISVTLLKFKNIVYIMEWLIKNI